MTGKLIATQSRKPESSYFNIFWTPAFAGVTIFFTFDKSIITEYCCFFFTQNKAIIPAAAVEPGHTLSEYV
jgi:hypothetical protein